MSAFLQKLKQWNIMFTFKEKNSNTYYHNFCFSAETKTMECYLSLNKMLNTSIEKNQQKISYYYNVCFSSETKTMEYYFSLNKMFTFIENTSNTYHTIIMSAFPQKLKHFSPS